MKMFVRRARVSGDDGREYCYLRLVKNTSKQRVRSQEIVIDFGSEKRFPDVMQAIFKFLGPAEFFRMATNDEGLARLAVVFHRLGPVALATIRGIVADAEHQAGPRPEEEIFEQLRDQIDGELQRDVDDDVPLPTARALKVAR
jgi:hypothetical protein